jgi:4-amino-4-deoxy-L-arabinose transferase-like glycosyltransferase
MKHRMNRSNHWRVGVLACIVVLAGILRISGIGSNPPSLSWDEVSIGYNAYSILKTARDEHGTFLPLSTFVAYGDYKPPLSVYATVPAVALFGLNEFAVRLPSAVAGTLMIVVTYMLVGTLVGYTSMLPLVTSVVLALSPWHIQLSRAGFEANIATLFVCLGVWLVVASMRQSKLWIVAWLPFVAAMYTFNSARYVVPLLGVGLLIYARPWMPEQRRFFLWGIVLSFLCLLPLLPHLFSSQARLRFQEVNIFSDPSIVLTANERMEHDEQSLAGRIVHNRRVGYVRSYLMHFFDHFDPQFLFVRGDGNPKFSIQDVGQLYMMEFPFLVAGSIWFILTYRKQGMLLLFWLLVSIAPAAVARETPHALRIENSLPVWHIAIASGILWVLSLLTNHWKKVGALGIFVGYVMSASYFLHNYTSHYPREFSGEWQYGYRQAYAYARAHEQNYEKIYVTESIGRAYMYGLFYTAYDPATFVKEKDSYFDAQGFYHVDGFGKYRFVGNTLPPFEPNTLYILPPGWAPKAANIHTTIHKLNGEPVLEVFSL